MLRGPAENSFPSSSYLHQYYSEIDDEEKFFLKNLHDLFNKNSFPSCNVPRIVLELGCGPLISGLASASFWADTLIFSDISKSNQKIVSESLYGQVELGPSFDYIGSLENLTSAELHLRMKSKMVLVTECNILQLPVVPNLSFGQSSVMVVTKLCLEFAVTNEKDLSKVLANISDIIPASGFLCSMGALEESFYMIGEKQFPALPLTRTIMENSLQSAGMEIIEWKEQPRVSDPKLKLTGHSGIYFMLAKKSL